MKKLCLVTGANRGIGFEIAKTMASKGYHVLLGCRNLEKAQNAVKEIAQTAEQHVQAIELDTSDEMSIKRAFAQIEKEFGSLDVLVNNAGVFLDNNQVEGSLNTPASVIRDTFATNTLGPFLMIQNALPLMRKKGFGRIVNISSGMGQLSDMNGGFAGYRISKAGLNAVTRIFADETSGEDILINSCCPGWVKTDMGGSQAEREISQGAETPVWLATLQKGGPTGGFFRDREPIAW